MDSIYHNDCFHTLLKELYAVFGNFLPWSSVYELLLSLFAILCFILYIYTTATRRTFLARLWTWPIIYYWMNYELLLLYSFIVLACGSIKTHNYCLYSLLGLIGRAPEFKSRCGHSWREFHLWLCFITFGGRSANSAYHANKSGCKT